MAMKEPMHKHEPDPKFLAEAEASIQLSETTETDDASLARDKQD